MKREEKNALSRERIFQAAMREFSAKGYTAASLNTVCAENNISKGIIYHYFKDKDELYLLCVTDCFARLTAYLAEAQEGSAGPIERRLNEYFDERLRFFAEDPLAFGIFASVIQDPPAHLACEIAEARRCFDDLNILVVTQFLENATLRAGMTIPTVVEDFRMYMDYFNLRFRDALAGTLAPEEVLREHEERCHQQVEIFLYGVISGS